MVLHHSNSIFQNRHGRVPQICINLIQSGQLTADCNDDKVVYEINLVNGWYEITAQSGFPNSDHANATTMPIYQQTYHGPRSIVRYISVGRTDVYGMMVKKKKNLNFPASILCLDVLFSKIQNFQNKKIPSDLKNTSSYPFQRSGGCCAIFVFFFWLTRNSLISVKRWQ